MKKLIIIAAIFFTTTASAQYIQMGAGSNGVTFGAGGQALNVDLLASYTFPFNSNTRPQVAALQLGYKIGLSDSWSILPRAGAAQVKWMEMTKADAIINHDEFMPIAQAELGWSAHMGTAYLAAGYCKETFITAGIRVHF